MAEETFTIGSEVGCTDGDAGELTRVVVDPVAGVLTHLVVEPKGRLGLARLVPIDLVDAAASAEQVRLTIHGDRVRAPGPGRGDPVRAGHAGVRGLRPAAGADLALLHGWAARRGCRSGCSTGSPRPSPTTRVPVGEVEVRRGDHVQATDGAIGHVEGLVIDPASHHVTHVLLQEGHLWGRKEVAIPISAVTSTDDGIWLSLTKHEVGALPPVDAKRPGH